MNATPECDLWECTQPIDPESPVRLCREHLWSAFAYMLQHAETRAAAVADPEPAPLPTPDRGHPWDEQGWVYFIRKGDLIKIGWTSHRQRRFRELQPDHVLATTPGTVYDERRCHAAFAHLREHGEWFRPEPDLLAFIDGIPAAA
jgi:hypothetical protein